MNWRWKALLLALFFALIGVEANFVYNLGEQKTQKEKSEAEAEQKRILELCKLNQDINEAGGQVRWDDGHPSRLIVSVAFTPLSKSIDRRMINRLCRLGDVGVIAIYSEVKCWPELARLRCLTKLHTLIIGIHAKDDDLAFIKELPHLQQLQIVNTDVGDAGLVHLSGMTDLETLCLNRTKVEGGGLKHLQGLTALRGIDLSDTAVTDDGLLHLKTLRSLEYVDARHTRVTEKGEELLHRYLPEVTVLWESSKDGVRP